MRDLHPHSIPHAHSPRPLATPACPGVDSHHALTLLAPLLTAHRRFHVPRPCTQGIPLPTEEELVALSVLMNDKLQRAAESHSTSARSFHERSGKTAGYIQLFNELDLGGPPPCRVFPRSAARGGGVCARAQASARA